MIDQQPSQIVDFTMGDMSDLDLVAKAMAPTNQPVQSDPGTAETSAPTKTTAKDATSSESTEEPIDLSSLTAEDMAMLKPLLDALNVKDTDDLDDASLQELIAQMDSAAGVADDLEGKLDRLIGDLGSFEQGIKEGMDDQPILKDAEKDDIKEKKG